jgi:hypothetical protein
MANVPIAGEPHTFTISLLSRADGQVLLNPTIGGADVLISTDGGALNVLNTLPAVTPANSGIVEVNLTSAEVGSDHFTVIFSDFTGAEWKTIYYHEVVGTAATGGGGGGSSYAPLTINIESKEHKVELE